MKQIQQVEEFRRVFKLPINNAPTLLDSNTFKLLHGLMKEENDEYLEACYDNDIVEIADALGDQLYIIIGTIINHGLQHKITEVFDEIQRSNMSKLDKDGNPIYREDGKVMKGENYFKPDIDKILHG